MALEPETVELIKGAIEARLLDVHTSTVGKCVSYDPKTQTATIKLQVQRSLTTKDDDTLYEDLCTIPNVPVGLTRVATHFIHLPLSAGDFVVVQFFEEAIGPWRETGKEGPPGDLRRHHFQSCIAYPMIAPATMPLTDAPNVGMDTDEAVLGGGVWRVGGKAEAQFAALSDKVDAAMELIKAHVHPTAMGPSGPAAELSAIESCACSKLKIE